MYLYKIYLDMFMLKLIILESQENIYELFNLTINMIEPIKVVRFRKLNTQTAIFVLVIEIYLYKFNSSYFYF
jgi:hypothetical protein